MEIGVGVQEMIRRDRIIVLSAATVLVLVSWLALIQTHSPSAPAHAILEPHATGGLAAIVIAALMWMGMTVAMMLPPVLPWILFFSSVAREQDARRSPLPPTALFASGYFAVWGGYCLVAATIQTTLQDLALLSAVELRTGPYLGGALLVGAGIFQLSPLKAACLKHCRSPLAFFLARWREGPSGAVGMGFRHGLYCLGCCWALMAVAFALGVMNLLWMAALTLILCVEKIAPGGQRLGRAFGVMLIVWGAALALVS